MYSITYGTFPHVSSSVQASADEQRIMLGAAGIPPIAWPDGVFATVDGRTYHYTPVTVKGASR